MSKICQCTCLCTYVLPISFPWQRKDLIIFSLQTCQDQIILICVYVYAVFSIFLIILSPSFTTTSISSCHFILCFHLQWSFFKGLPIFPVCLLSSHAFLHIHQSSFYLKKKPPRAPLLSRSLITLTFLILITIFRFHLTEGMSSIWTTDYPIHGATCS